MVVIGLRMQKLYTWVGEMALGFAGRCLTQYFYASPSMPVMVSALRCP